MVEPLTELDFCPVMKKPDEFFCSQQKRTDGKHRVELSALAKEKKL
jgi:hypothetical protein